MEFKSPQLSSISPHNLLLKVIYSLYYSLSFVFMIVFLYCLGSKSLKMCVKNLSMMLLETFSLNL